uniref:Zinc finger protein OZF-like n=1 Tax=Fundulus heteroclitus TaxID=8078 RepID=A0A3Q2QM78_FUNHE
MSEMMKVEAHDPGGLRLVPPIPAASTLDLGEKQDKDLKLPVYRLLMIKEEVPHDGCSNFDQVDPKPSHIKEEKEEQWISQEGEHLTVKSEDEEKPQLAEIIHIKTDGNQDTEVSTSSSAEQMERETDGEDFGEPQPDRNPVPGGFCQQSKITVQKKRKRSKLCLIYKRQVGIQGDKPFGCDVCGKRFKRRTHIKLHMMIHTGKTEHSCDVCSKGFKDKTSLLTHMRLHTGERPFACHDCGKRFHAKGILKAHLKVHSEEKPFSCDVCGSKFKMKATLKKHMPIHLKEKPFVCSVCSKGFSQQTNLSVHMSVHTSEKPFICNICSKGFSLPQFLKRHMSVHTGEKSFVCSVCYKGFSRQNCLKIHMHIHTGEKPFSCCICSKGFSRPAYLRKHMNVHMV